MKNIIKTFSLTEKVVFYTLSTIFIVTSLILLYQVNDRFSVAVPERGGSLVEGLVGTPRLINPILAVSETDKDLTSLIYSGLMRATPDNGLVPDIAESYSISDDGLTYTFTIRNDAVFHDGTPITADDVIFTIVSAQNPQIKSPKRSNWADIAIEKISDKQIVFRLTKPYTPFLHNMTLGILPKHIWSVIDVNEFALSNFNIEPIGSGPYQVAEIVRDTIGIPTSYIIESFDDFTLGEPYIKNIEFRFAKNQDELVSLYENGDIDAVHGINGTMARTLLDKGIRVAHVPLPRIFGVFFNPDQAMVLSTNPVRKALSMVSPKQAIVDDVLSGFGSVIDSPIPAHIFAADSLALASAEALSKEARFQNAAEILEKAGWNKNEQGVWARFDETAKATSTLSFSVTTGNAPELVSAAKHVVAVWNEFGAQVELKTFEPTDLNSSVIRPRNYDALLFGMVIGRDKDFYAFWHSSQRNDPGLNIAKYANSAVDEVLESIRVATSTNVITNGFMELNNAIQKDVPAVFLYTPEFIYVLPENIKGFELTDIVTSEERFLNIHKWYIYTDKVWEIFI